MKSIKIAGKTFKLASRMERLYALFIDLALLSAVQVGLVFLISIIGLLLVGTNPFDMGESLLAGFGLSIFGFLSSAVLWTFGLFFIDGFRKGQGIGKKLLSLQVLRLKDGKPCTFKDAFIRQSYKYLSNPWMLLLVRLENSDNGLGDKLAETIVVVKFDSDVRRVRNTKPKILRTNFRECNR